MGRLATIATAEANRYKPRKEHRKRLDKCPGFRYDLIRNLQALANMGADAMARKSPVTPQDVTIFDVAREANVSYSTVSRVINKKGVSADKRERVLRAMADLGYVVNLQARSLAGGKSNIIGLLVHSLTVEYFGEIARGVDDELAALQY